MHIKFSGGRASAGRAAAYLTGELDSQGEEREAVIVLRGDPELVAAVADGLEFAPHVHLRGSCLGSRRPADRRPHLGRPR